MTDLMQSKRAKFEPGELQKPEHNVGDGSRNVLQGGENQ